MGAPAFGDFEDLAAGHLRAVVMAPDASPGAGVDGGGRACRPGRDRVIPLPG